MVSKWSFHYAIFFYAVSALHVRSSCIPEAFLQTEKNLNQFSTRFPIVVGPAYQLLIHCHNFVSCVLQIRWPRPHLKPISLRGG